MINGKKFYLYNGYTYSFGFASRVGQRWRCSCGCKAFIVVSTDVTFAKSQRGGQLIVFKGYSYSLQKYRDTVVQWRCTMVQPGTAKRCTAKLFTDIEYKVLENCGDHCHRKPKFIKRDNVLVRVY
ncbi:hypothetical protein ABMA27_001304 [Loxostege sticticalis]|uniref:FLYWCH-type domain-containing protein n=1 Tax=Loxostege sticticalis TaxID=481309 RepID=A0ABR3HY03_LOXSC